MSVRVGVNPAMVRKRSRAQAEDTDRDTDRTHGVLDIDYVTVTMVYILVIKTCVSATLGMMPQHESLDCSNAAKSPYFMYSNTIDGACPSTVHSSSCPSTVTVLATIRYAIFTRAPKRT